MKEKITEVQLLEPLNFEPDKKPKQVKLKFPFLEVPVVMNDKFFEKILNNQRYKIVINNEAENKRA